MSGLLMRSSKFFAAEFSDFSELSDADFAARPLPEHEYRARPAAPTVGIVVTGDNHLSAALPRLSPQRRAERRARLRGGFSAAVNYAIEHNARLFIQAGDLFDSPTPSNQDRAFVAAALGRLRRAGVTCVAISGNHDTPRMVTEHGGQAPQQTYAELDAMTYFGETAALRPKLLTLDGLHLAVAGLSNNPVAPPGSDPLSGAPFVDPMGVLERADLGLLILHAAIEGLSQPHEGERTVTRASLEALPAPFKLIVAGHIHRFGQQRIGDRSIVVCGATERMEFGTAAGGAGFAWIELTRDGVTRAEHIRIAEQPRADLTLPTSRLWPKQADAHEAPPATDACPAAAPAETLAVLADVLPESFASASAAAAAASSPNEGPPSPLDTICQTLAALCTPETMVRLRLVGSLTRDQYHQLALREILRYGQQHAFSFDLDTSGLRLLRPSPSALAAQEGAGPISPVRELGRVVAERLATVASERERADLHAAADLLRGRLRAPAREEDAR